MNLAAAINMCNAKLHPQGSGNELSLVIPKDIIDHCKSSPIQT